MSRSTQHHLLVTADTTNSVFECSACGERFLGERRCPNCNLFGRYLGLGGACPKCDQIVLLNEMFDLPNTNL